MNLAEAANLIQRGYDSTLGPLVKKPFDEDGVQAFMLNDGTLVIPGTNEKSDWRTNVDIGRVGRGASGQIWHQGFLKHARAVFAFAAPFQPKRVLGHSLGAAAAQIVAMSFDVPGICFASPRPMSGNRIFRNKPKVINICRRDDLITGLPPGWLGWRHVGATHWISPRERQSEGSHSLEHYLRAMEKGRSKPPLPKNWG